MILKYIVKESDAGRKIYSIMRRELCISAALTRRLKQVNGIFLNEERVFTNHTVLPGETIAINITAAEPPCDNIPEEGTLALLYEDAGLLAVNKPSGCITHPSHARNTGTLANLAAGYLLRTTGDGCCHAVNRLDRDTSGVVLFAKNSHMKARAAEAIASPDAKKEYLALICGMMEISPGIIDLPIKRLNEGDMRRVIAPDGQRAVTHYETIATRMLCGHTISLLQIYLETGRTHQIRVHCRASGHPVLGDMLYYTEESRAVSEELGILSQALHAYRLSFTEPISGTHIDLTAPITQVFTHIFGKELIDNI
jgi:23S rRNA pseudouridine1911/1915/1917 synthase